MKEKQNRMKRTIIIAMIGGIPLFGALAFTGQAEKKVEIKQQKIFYLEALAESVEYFSKPEERNVYMGDSIVVYDEYLYSDLNLNYEVSFLSPKQQGLMPILEIHNLKTDNYFYDYGCNTFCGEREDGFYLEEKKFDLNFKNLNQLYKQEVEKVLALMYFESKNIN